MDDFEKLKSRSRRGDEFIYFLTVVDVKNGERTFRWMVKSENRAITNLFGFSR
jgi:hypothetical protein